MSATNGKARMSGTAKTVWHAACLEYGQDSQRRVVTGRNKGNTTPDPETTRQSKWREEVESRVSCVWKGDDWVGKTPSNGSLESDWWLPFITQWDSNESADMLEATRDGCTSSRTNGTSARNATCTASAKCNYVTGSLWEWVRVVGPESQAGQIPEITRPMQWPSGAPENTSEHRRQDLECRRQAWERWRHAWKHLKSL